MAPDLLEVTGEWVARYAQSHQHPVNRLCHTFGIPMIVASVPLFVAAIFIVSK